MNLWKVRHITEDYTTTKKKKKKEKKKKNKQYNIYKINVQQNKSNENKGRSNNHCWV